MPRDSTTRTEAPIPAVAALVMAGALVTALCASAGALMLVLG